MIFCTRHYVCSAQCVKSNMSSERVICVHIEFSNHLHWLTEFVLTVCDSRINLIIELNFTGKSVAIFNE